MAATLVSAFQYNLKSIPIYFGVDTFLRVSMFVLVGAKLINFHDFCKHKTIVFCFFSLTANECFEMGCLFGLKMANYLHGRELFLKFVTQNKVIP